MRSLRQFRFWKPEYQRGAWIGFACASIAWAMGFIPYVAGLDEWFYDGMFCWRGKRESATKILIIGLDDASINALNKPLMTISPELDEVLQFVNRQGASAVGIDLIVPVEAMQHAELQPSAKGDPSGLGTTILESGNVALARWKQTEGWQDTLFQWRLKSLNPESASPTDVGFVNLTSDKDHFARRQQLIFQDELGIHFHFSLAVWAISQGEIPRVEETGLWVGDHRIPLDEQQQVLINYVGPPGTIPVVPFEQVLESARSGGSLMQGESKLDLSGLIVLIGSVSESLQDMHATPYANNYFRELEGEEQTLMPGVEIHANLIAMMNENAYLHTLPAWATLLMLLGVGIFLGITFARVSLMPGLGITVVHHLLWKVIALAALALFAVRLNLASMFLLGVIAYGATFALRWRRLRRMFGVVQSESIARELEANGYPLNAQSESRDVTILFSDIRGYTTFSERHKGEPQKVVRLLNRYFEAIIPIIDRHGGTLNSYMGDGIMVMYGAPVPREDAPLRAVLTAIEIVQTVHRLSETWKELGNPGMRIGVGVQTGPAIVGAVGSPRRLDYTAIGDVTNSAARTEAENKEQGTEILIGKSTMDALPEEVRAKLLTGARLITAKVKGKDLTLELYAICPERPGIG